MEIKQSDVRNRLLRALRADDFDRLQPHLQRLSVQFRQTLITPGVDIDALFFPESGFVSITTSAPSRQVEIGMIGREGLVGAAPALLGNVSMPYEHYVQVPGDGLRIGIAEFQAACGQSAALRQVLLRFVQALLIQTAQTAFVNATCGLDARLARWVLMCQDRLGNEFPVTHEFLAVMLAVQRTSVTLALQNLEGRGLIRARRGRIEVRDRERLIDAADHGYGLPEAEYDRLIGGPQA